MSCSAVTRSARVSDLTCPSFEATARCRPSAGGENWRSLMLCRVSAKVAKRDQAEWALLCCSFQRVTVPLKLAMANILPKLGSAQQTCSTNPQQAYALPQCKLQSIQVDCSAQWLLRFDGYCWARVTLQRLQPAIDHEQAGCHRSSPSPESNRWTAPLVDTVARRLQ